MIITDYARPDIFTMNPEDEDESDGGAKENLDSQRGKSLVIKTTSR